MNRLFVLLITLCMASTLVAAPPFSDYEARIAALEALLANVTRGIDPNTGYDTIQFSGMNVQIVNGSGYTNISGGTGNLIIGYNELRDAGNYRNGSHNLVLGTQNSYSAAGGLVAGYLNEIHGSFPSISGGSYNLANGTAPSISGGWGNTAIGSYSSISGGIVNQADGYSSSISGGEGNFTIGNYSSVSGGMGNVAFGDYSSVSGGAGREAFGEHDWVAGSLWEDD